MALQLDPANAGSNGIWIPLIEYSVKSGVSLSTIRRKIKSNTIPFKLEKGKYLILFQEVGEATPTNTTTSPVFVPRNVTREESTLEKVIVPAPRPHQQKLDRLVGNEDDESTVRMLSEAYEHALGEKDHRIRLLEKQVRDQSDRLNELKLLVQVLEEKYEVRY